MTDKDDRLLREFFRPAAELQLEDDGFSRRVMRRLPVRRARRWSQWWTVFCVAVFVALFVAWRGWETVVTGVVVFVQTAPVEFSPQVLLAALAGLAVAAFSEVFYSRRAAF